MVWVAASTVVVLGTAAVPGTPRWTAALPNPLKPLGGYPMASGAIHTEVYHGGLAHGTYNHAAMLDYLNGSFLLMWKNGAESEDKDGQRILFANSTDGLVWSPTDGNNVLFPSLSTSSQECAMFVGPPVHLNHRAYAAASPGIPGGAADGAQFCLWPDPVSPRNCGPPGYPQQTDTLLLREILGPRKFGPIFWAAETAPSAWVEATKVYGIKTVGEMDPEIRGDVELLSATMPALPCADSRSSGTLKCEACLGGCQLWDDIHIPPPPSPPSLGLRQRSSPPKSAISNERTHYVVSNGSDGGSGTANNPGDVLLYRSGAVGYLYASVRAGGDTSQSGWTPPVLTDIPNDESNLNAGSLPDGRVYLLNNAVFAPKQQTWTKEHSTQRSTPSGLGTLRFRDPVVLSTSIDGTSFDTAVAVISCTQLPHNSTCAPRFAGGGKNPGPSYPQGLAVVAPAPQAVRGFYVVATNNKEDVWITKLNYSAF